MTSASRSLSFALFLPVVALSFAALALHSNSPILHYLWQNPRSLGHDFPLRWARDILVPISLASALLSVCWLVGRRILGFVSVPDEDCLADIEAMALGAGAWALTLLLLGLLNGFRPWPIVLVSIVLMFLSVPWGAWPFVQARGRSVFSWSPLHAFLGGIILFAFWHGLICALAPPTDMDVLTYHLPIPKHYLAQGSIRAMPWLLYSLWPHLMEVFYALALLMRQEAVAALLNLGAYVLTAIAVFRLGREWFDEQTAWLACALLAVQPIFAGFAGTARIDGWWCLFNLLACVSVWRWALTGRLAWLIRGGCWPGWRLPPSCWEPVRWWCWRSG